MKFSFATTITQSSRSLLLGLSISVLSLGIFSAFITNFNTINPGLVLADNQCILSGQDLINARDKGEVTVALQNNGRNAVVTNNSDCLAKIGFASYGMFGSDRLLDQHLNDGVNALVSPRSTQTLTINVPDCNYQVDAWPYDFWTSFPSNDFNGLLMNAAQYMNGKWCGQVPSPSPSPSVSPSPSPSVSPSPSPSQSTIQCPVGQIQKIENSTVVCVAQKQEQTQTQTQDNHQNQTVDQHVSATGGSSSSSSSSSSSVNVTVNNPTPTPTPSTTSVVNVVSEAKTEVKQLPKTGLPLAAWALTGLLPIGAGFKRFGKKSDALSANSVWMERQLNS